MARFDRLNQGIAPGPPVHTQAWSIGSEKALTTLGNVVLRASYSHERDQDPVAGSVTLNKLFMLDVRLMW